MRLESPRTALSTMKVAVQEDCRKISVLTTEAMTLRQTAWDEWSREGFKGPRGLVVPDGSGPKSRPHRA